MIDDYDLTQLLFGPNLLQCAKAMSEKDKQKSKTSMPLELIGKDAILMIRHQYFNGVTIEDIAAENNFQVEDVEGVVDAMNL